MEIRLEGTGGGAKEIRLEYASVISELENVKQMLSSLTLPEPNERSNGNNKLNYTEQWLERESNLQVILKQYIEVVHKNIEDTKANVAMLKEQDEAIRRS